MTDIGPGDWVECIDAGPNRFGDSVPFEVGSVHKILNIDVTKRGTPVCNLVGWNPIPKTSRKYKGFRLSRFRPIYRPKGNELLRSLFDTPHFTEPHEAFTP